MVVVDRYRGEGEEYHDLGGTPDIAYCIAF
jgi:hypothetical protein